MKLHSLNEWGLPTFWNMENATELDWKQEGNRPRLIASEQNCFHNNFLISQLSPLVWLLIGIIEIGIWAMLRNIKVNIFNTFILDVICCLWAGTHLKWYPYVYSLCNFTTELKKKHLNIEPFFVYCWALQCTRVVQKIRGLHAL